MQSDSEDQMFVNRCLEGDWAAFAFLVDKYKEVVHAYAYHRINDYQGTQDVVQEVFIKAYRKLGQLKWPHRFRSWLYTIASNECKMWLRKHSREHKQEMPLEDVPVEELDELAVRSHSDEDIELTVRSAMETLPTANQLVLSLHYMSGQSVKEIAEFMGISPGNVKVRLHRARKQLGERLENMIGKQMKKEKLRSGFVLTMMNSIRNMPIPSLPKPRPTKWMPIPISIGLALLIGIIGYGVSSGKDISSNTPILKPAETTFEVSLLSDMEALDTESEDISQSDLESADAGATTQTQPAGGTKSSGMVVRRVWEHTLNASAYAVSPDGRYVSYINWDNGNLAIHDFETGENREVTDEGNWGKDREFADNSIWSPDSKNIIYLWLEGPYQTRDASLRIVGIDGSKPRVLCSSSEGSEAPFPMEWVPFPVEWSRDGKHILALHCIGKGKPHDHDIVLVSVADGSIRVLKSLGHHGPDMSLSPDGGYVVYNYPQSEDSTKTDISLLATDGSHEMTLVEHPADDGEPIWAPDGNGIVFASDRSGSMGVWVLEVIDGKPKGYPRLINDNLDGMNPLGLTQDGSYYYGLGSMDSDVYMATIDPETGKVVTPPTKAVQSHEGFNYAPDFSPDGKSLAYASLRPRGKDGDLRVLMIRSLETGEERELLPELTSQHFQRQWSPDGRSIITTAGADLSWESRGLYQIDTETDAATPVVLNDEQGSIRPTPLLWSPDGSKIFFMRALGGIKVIRAHDFETKREWSPDFRLKGGEAPEIHDMALSPDGRQLAFLECLEDEHSYQIAPSTGGETREVLRVPKPNGRRLVWTPDGRHLLFGKRKDEETELWQIPVEGGESQNLGLTMKKMNHLSIHPDGRRITFTGPGPGRGAEVWVMENILPTSTASR